ncbi:TetR/AcrR family transcriptional regulator [Pseudonocardia sp. MH-G8]|uniref:TetR/AcrR family transcriptional regulator n=1 Tax=Pseudonocardia sp. MH-G8 TaxID=1854588 RepID=UPI000B9FF1C6|nr:TetR/AcrR family transcriptional regulator [Pseudonocardia sp. MH-G8]OZM81964.1 TetR family transcriptional regulator [Pseudonocardia sp. MH-G8]
MPSKRLTREESRARTRDLLLDAAAALFAERGVNGTSVEQIAERAGFTRGAFYGNFADKHELVRELLHRRTEQELVEVRALGGDAEGYARLREWNRERAEHLEEWLALRLELLLHALRHPEARPALAQREGLARDAHAQALTARFRERGVAPPADPQQLALIVHALEDGLLLQRMLAPERLPADVVVDAVELLDRLWSR